MKRLLENGARPVPRLVSLWLNRCIDWARSFSSLITRKKLYWASRKAATRIAGCASAHVRLSPAGRTFFLKKSLIARRKKNPICLKQLSGGQCMAPVKAVKVLLATCPRALLRSTLTALTSTMTRRLGIASNKTALQERP
jgi:hypothetical protein